MLMYSAAIFAGLILLVWGADLMVAGASVTARHFGVSPMLVGLTVVGFATSAPELLVAVAAAINDAPDLAVGNAIGSNIANIGLIGGATGLLYPLLVRSQTLRSEFPVMVAVSIAPLVVFLDDQLSRSDGLLLLGTFAVFMYWVTRLGLRTRGHDQFETEYASEMPTGISIPRAVVQIVAGLIALSIGAETLVWGCQSAAIKLGISNLVIGITVVAIGTSLPELAVSLTSARKGEHALAFGNIIGSNGFNSLAVIGIAGTIRPEALEHQAITLHWPAMLIFTIVFFLMAYNWSGTIRVGRLAGGVLLCGFAGYHGFVAYQTF